MKENAEKIRHLEGENRSVREENLALKERVETFVQQNPTVTNLQIEAPTPETGSSRRQAQESGVDNLKRNMIEARQLDFEEEEGVNPMTPNPQVVNDSHRPTPQPVPVVTPRRVSFENANPRAQTESPHPNNTTVSPMNNLITLSTGAWTSNDELASKISNLEEMVQRIPGVPAPIKKSLPNSFADSPFVDAIALVEMPAKFNFPSMKLYDGTTDPDDHVSQYKQRMFTIAIPRDLREACMCKGFGSSLVGPALQWYTTLDNNFISSFAQLVDCFVEQFASC